MKSMSNDIISKDQIDAVVKAAKADVDKLRADVMKSHFWLSVSIMASIVFSAAGLALALIVHH